MDLKFPHGEMVLMVSIFVLFWLWMRKHKKASEHRGFNRAALADAHDKKECTPHARRKPDWVVHEVLRLKVLMGSSGCRKIATTFNRLHNVGIGQVNSIHFKELSGHGIAPGNLLDPCVGTYVAAWHLGRQVQLHGNTWFAIGAYQSVTPYYNSRYQALVFNTMVDMRTVPGPKLAVAPLKPDYVPQAIATVR